MRKIKKYDAKKRWKLGDGKWAKNNSLKCLFTEIEYEELFGCKTNFPKTKLEVMRSELEKDNKYEDKYIVNFDKSMKCGRKLFNEWNSFNKRIKEKKTRKISRLNLSFDLEFYSK